MHGDTKLIFSPHNNINVCINLPLSLAVDGSLAPPPITPSQTSVCTLNVQVIPGFGWGCGLVQVAVVVLDLMGQEPQFSARILYLIARQSDPTGSQLKVSWLGLTRVNITLDGGGRGSAVILCKSY